MKKAEAMLVVIISIFSSVFSFAILNAAQPSPLDNLSDLKQALPSGGFALSKAIKAAAHAYEVAVVKGKDQKEIEQLKKRFLTILPKQEEDVFSVFLYAITSSFDSVVTLLITHQLLCKNKNFTSELKDAVEKGDVEFLFSQFDDAPVAWHSVPGCKVTEKIKKISVPTCLEDVSDDCLGNILSYIDGNEMLCKKIVVCERWRQFIYRKPNIVTSVNTCKIPSESIEKLAPYVPNIENLIFDHEQMLGFIRAGFRFKALSNIKVKKTKKEVDSADLQQSFEKKTFAQVFPHVISVDFSSNDLDSPEIGAYIKNCENFEIIRLVYGYPELLTDIKHIAKTAKSLRVIDLNCCKQITDEALQLLVRSCKKIQKISLRACLLITDKAIMTLAENLHDLRVIAPPRSITEKAVIALVKNCKKLEYIDLRRCKGVSESYRKIFANQKEVEQLREALLQSSSQGS